MSLHKNFNTDYAQYKAFGEAFKKSNEVKKLRKEAEDSYEALVRLHKQRCQERTAQTIRKVKTP